MSPRATLDANLTAADLQQIDAICDQFEAQWQGGHSPEIERYLSQASPAARVSLFRDLLHLELEYRQRHGEEPDRDSYRRRFPAWAGVVDLAFSSEHEPAIAKRPEGACDRICGSTATSPGPIERVEGPSPSADLFMGTLDQPGVPGYEILSELGHGGMGVVLKAYQVALNRSVALKMIKSGSFASERELLRFQNEAEAVAQLDHPHIVPIYEVGRHQGRPFFSMKLIEGSSLDKRLGEFGADPGAAARIVATVASAVHHAHQRGILNRDLKPANILLDERGEPHVTDFGLAKRIEGDGELTQWGAPVGTPSYMAPEQVSALEGSLSTATDVYGLGTILYALLTGRAPFAGTTLDETLDMVRTCAPEPPSLSNKQVPRDLEIICLKCLEKEPSQRYSSALAFAEDLDRWQNGMPILARPVGPMTRAAMWCRRNKALASLAALLMLAVLGGVAGVTRKWIEAERERAKTTALNELLTRGLLAQASSDLDPLSKNLTVRELLDRAGSQLGGWLNGQRDIEANVRETIGGAYLSLRDYEKAEPHLRKAIELDTQFHGPLHRDTLRATNLLASLLDQTGRGALAEPLLLRNLADCRSQLGLDDPITLDAAERLGAVFWHVGKADVAATVLRKNVGDRSRILKPEHPDTLRSTYLLCRVLRERRQFGDAEHFAYLFAHSVQCSLGSNHPENVVALANRGDVFHDQGKLAEAETCYRQAAIEAERIHGREHRSTVAALRAHEQVLRELGPGRFHTLKHPE
jgi:serine/threonine-protein kinase